MKKNYLYLDFDGVLANWTKAVCDHNNHILPEKTHIPNWFAGNLFNKSCEELMKSIDYWSNLEPYPHANELVETINDVFGQNWCFLTKGIGNHSAFAGKAIWCEKHFPKYIKRLVVTGVHKHNMCRHPSQILVDDNDKNLLEWKNNGGTIFKWHEITHDWTEMGQKQISDLKTFLEPYKKDI